MALNPLAEDSSRRSAAVSRSGCAPCRYRFTPLGQSIPRLNGNSSHGSKPLTSLSRTFNCTPHCCPQKQQCVFTNRSGSVLVESRKPVIVDRCGPYASMIFSGSAGRIATTSPLGGAFAQSVAPGLALCQAEQRASASRADLLIMIGALHVVRKAQLTLDRRQVPNHHGRRVRTSTATTGGLLAARSS